MAAGHENVLKPAERAKNSITKSAASKKKGSGRRDRLHLIE